MSEKISMTLPELNPEVQKSNKERKNSWLKSDFGHIGSTQNGSFVREWNTSEFRKQINYVKTEDDTMFYLRTILQDPKMRDLFMEKMNVSVDEFWLNSYEREEQPEMTREEYLEKHLWKSLAVDVEVEGVLKTLPDNFLLETLKVYNQEASRIRLETLEIIDRMRQDFLPNFKDFVSRYNLTVNWPEIENKFDAVSYDLFDEYYSSNKSGDYNADSHFVRVEISPFSQVSFSTLQHEHIHAISGRKNVLGLIVHGRLYNNEVYTFHNIPRLGVRFSASSSHPARFSWLNEAITEHINYDIVKEVMPQDEHSYNESYHRERELFELILAGGKKPIPARLFYQAYFESDTENPEDLKHRKELYEEVSKAYGSPRFLVELDDMIKKINIKPTIEIFKTTGQKGVHEWWLNEFVNQKEKAN